MPKNTAASFRQRLLNLARERHEDFDYVLRQYVMQRLLYRLSISHYAGQFLLKGALLFWIWNEAFYRPTRDIDLLSYGDHDVPYLVKVFREIISAPVDDGLVFDIEAVTGVEIKEGADYPGVRLTGFALLAKARIPFQVDIGYGDTVVPEAEEAVLPSFLDLPPLQLRVYPVYGVIAEKFQAMVMLGLANSRMKDFFDIRVIASTMTLDGDLLAQAIRATFEMRKTVISHDPLSLFSDDFARNDDKQMQWQAFLGKNSIEDASSFIEVMQSLQQFLEPVYQAIADKRPYLYQWPQGEFKWMDV